MDFFPFTREVYLRLFIRQNLAVWPAQLLAVPLGLLAIWLACHDQRRRWAWLILAAAWMWVGYSFHLQLYAPLSWAAVYFGWLFFAQGALLLPLVLWPHGHTSGGPALRGFGVGLAIFGLALYPVLGPLNGRAWLGSELFGLTPNPTVLVSLGVALTAGRAGWAVLPAAFAWCAISGVTAWAMDAPAGLAMPAAGFCAFGVTFAQQRQPRRASM